MKEKLKRIKTIIKYRNRAGYPDIAMIVFSVILLITCFGASALSRYAMSIESNILMILVFVIRLVDWFLMLYLGGLGLIYFFMDKYMADLGKKIDADENGEVSDKDFRNYHYYEKYQKYIETASEYEICDELCKHSIGESVILSKPINFENGKTLETGTVMIIRDIMFAENRHHFFRVRADELYKYEADDGVFAYLLSSDDYDKAIVSADFIGDELLTLKRYDNSQIFFYLIVIAAILIVIGITKYPICIIIGVCLSTIDGFLICSAMADITTTNKQPIIRKKKKADRA